MKRTCVLLLALSLLMPCFALTEGPRVAPPAGVDFSSSGPIAGAEVAWRLLDDAYATNDLEARIGLIMKAAKAAPDNIDILLNCASSLIGSDLMRRYTAEAESMLKEAMRLATGEQWLTAIKMLAEVMIIDERAQEATKLIEDAMLQEPNNETLKVLLASTLYYGSRNDEALKILEALAEDSPRNLDALRLRAAILTDECMWDEALTAYGQIDQQWPEYLDGMYGMYLVYSASGQFDRAARTIDKLLRDGAEEGLWLERARIRLWKQYRPEDALQEAEALLHADPEWIDAYTVKLGAYLMMEDYQGARETIDALKAQDEAYGILMEGIVAINEEKWADAERVFGVLIEKVPTTFIGWQYMGSTKLEGYDDPDAAMDFLGKAYEHVGAWLDYDMFTLLGRVYRRQGNLLQAARSFAEADRLTNESPAPLYYLMVTLADAGRPEDMLDMVAELERRYPGWYETMLARALVEDVLGNAQEALSAYMAFKEKFPFPAGTLNGMEATLMAAAGDAQGPALAKAEIDAMENPGALEWETYAFALFLIGDIDAAEEALGTADALLAKEDKGSLKARDARINIETTRADILLARGDSEGCTKALERAAADGFLLSALKCYPRFSEYCKTEEYHMLLEQQSPQMDDWDLSVAPEIPQVPESLKAEQTAAPEPAKTSL